MCRNKKMDVIGHKLLSVQEEPFVLSNRYVKVFEGFSRITDHNLTAIFYRPYEMVGYVIYAPSCTYPVPLLDHSISEYAPQVVILSCGRAVSHH